MQQVIESLIQLQLIHLQMAILKIHTRLQLEYILKDVDTGSQYGQVTTYT